MLGQMTNRHINVHTGQSQRPPAQPLVGQQFMALRKASGWNAVILIQITDSISQPQATSGNMYNKFQAPLLPSPVGAVPYATNIPKTLSTNPPLITSARDDCTYTWRRPGIQTKA